MQCSCKGSAGADLYSLATLKWKQEHPQHYLTDSEASDSFSAFRKVLLVIEEPRISPCF